MWVNAEPDGRPAEHRWRPLFVAYRPLVELVALFALMPKYTGRTTDFSHPRVRFLRDHFSTQGRRA